MELQRKYGMQLRRFTPRMKIHQKFLKLKVFSIIYVKEDMFGFLAKEFEIKYLGNLKYFLGIELLDQERVFLFLNENVFDLLKEIGMLGCKPIDTLMDSTTKLGAKEDNEMVGKGKYQRPVKNSYIFLTLDLISISLLV
ncbi:hypothetical protein AAG906_037418 [Vitis piasezkii]